VIQLLWWNVTFW